MNREVYVAIVVCLLLLVQARQPSQASAADTEYSRAGASVFVIRQGSKLHRLKLNVTIAGWKVACSRSRAVVWGQTLADLPVGNPPYASVYVLDLPSGKIIGEISTTRGPFDIDFTKDQKYIVVDETLINFISGRVASTELPPGFKFEPESCTEFPGKSSR